MMNIKQVAQFSAYFAKMQRAEAERNDAEFSLIHTRIDGLTSIIEDIAKLSNDPEMAIVIKRIDDLKELKISGNMQNMKAKTGFYGDQFDACLGALIEGIESSE